MRMSQEINITVGNSSQQLLPANPRRRAIVVTTDTNPVLITQSPTAATGKGIQIPQTIQPTNLCCRQLGSWITYELQIIAPLGTTHVCVIEVLADPNDDYDMKEGMNYYA